MSQHPGDTTTNRIRAFWAGLLAFVSFGAVLWLGLKAAGPRQAVEPGLAERASARTANLEEIRTAQAALVSPDAIEQSVTATVTKLKGKTAAASAVVVPGSPTFMKQSQETAPAAPAAGEPAPAPAAPAPAPDAAKTAPDAAAPAPTPAPAK